MKTRKPRKSGQRRTLNLYARFTPSGPEETDCDSYHQFWLEANTETQRLRAKELSSRKSHLTRLAQVRDKTFPLFQKILVDEISVEAGAAELRRLVPDQQIAREAFEIWQKAIQTTPEQAAEQRREIERHEKELARSERIFKAQKQIVHSLFVLAEETEAGNAEAAEAFMESAIAVACEFSSSEKKHPELFKSLVRKQRVWPVLAEEEAGWERAAVRHLKEIGLGLDAHPFGGRFHKPRGADENLPARRWAKSAVKTIEVTRLRVICCAVLQKSFGRELFVDFLMRKRWSVSERPSWAQSAFGLEPFSKSALPEWKAVIRKMIREAFPDFHMHDDWRSHRRSAELIGRDTKGEIQNAILDDICSALKRIAPDVSC